MPIGGIANSVKSFLLNETNEWMNELNAIPIKINMIDVIIYDLCAHNFVSLHYFCIIIYLLSFQWIFMSYL